MSFQADTSWFSKHHILPLSSQGRTGSFCGQFFQGLSRVPRFVRTEIFTLCVGATLLLGSFALPGQSGLCRAEGASGSQFWSHWGDGKAELSGYALRVSRYGQPRDGRLVLIYVTEDFSDSARVKAEPGRRSTAPGDVYPVLKIGRASCRERVW